MTSESLEVRSRPLSPEDVDKAILHLHDRGYAILENVIPRKEIEAARAEYLQTFEEFEATNSTRLQTSHSGSGYYQIQPNLAGRLGGALYLANPAVLQCLRPILGAGLKIAFYNSNLTRPGSSYQRVHRDCPPTFDGEISVPTPPSLLAVNILLCDFTTENGSTEVWPGTHLIVDTLRGTAGATDLEKRTEGWPATRTNAPAGSAVIRDLRLWHRGTPNRTTAPRMMLSLVYKRNWVAWRNHASLDAPAEVMADWPVEVQELVRP